MFDDPRIDPHGLFCLERYAGLLLLDDHAGNHHAVYLKRIAAYRRFRGHRKLEVARHLAGVRIREREERPYAAEESVRLDHFAGRRYRNGLLFGERRERHRDEKHKLHHEPRKKLREARTVGDRRALGYERRIIEQRYGVREFLALQPGDLLDKRMLRIELKDALLLRHFVLHGAPHPHHRRRQRILLRHEAARGIRQTGGYADIADLRLKLLLDALDKWLERLRGLLVRILLGLLLSLAAEADVALRDIHELLAVELPHRLGQELVHRIAEQQHVAAMLAGGLKLGCLSRILLALGEKVVDVLLVARHVLDVVLQEHRLAGVAAGRRILQELLQALRVRPVDMHALLQHGTERAPELAVLLLVLLHRLECREDLRRDGALYLRDHCIVLQHFAGYIKRQVAGVHHTLHEPEVARQKHLYVVADKHVAHVERKTALLLRHEKLHSGLLRKE